VAAGGKDHAAHGRAKPVDAADRRQGVVVVVASQSVTDQLSRAAGPALGCGLIPLIASALWWAIGWNFHPISWMAWSR
jgi:hypothetical protein